MGGALSITGRLLAGFFLGTVFFGGLWLTVRALSRSRHPAALVIGSLWGRTAVVLVGFVWVMAGRWQNGLLCMIGFLAARLVVARGLQSRLVREVTRGRDGHNT